MKNLFSKLRMGMSTTAFGNDERGLSTVEYVIILVLIAAAAIGTWVTFGGKVRDKIEASNKAMDEVQVQSKPSK